MPRLLLATNICYGSINPFNPTRATQANETIQKIFAAATRHDAFVVVNDEHVSDDREFFYLPPHQIEGSRDCVKITPPPNCPPIQWLRKNTLSALRSMHNRKVIEKFGCDEITLAGSQVCIDLLSTALDLIDLKWNVTIRTSQELVSCTTKETKQRGLDVLKFLGVKID